MFSSILQISRIPEVYNFHWGILSLSWRFIILLRFNPYHIDILYPGDISSFCSLFIKQLSRILENQRPTSVQSYFCRYIILLLFNPYHTVIPRSGVILFSFSSILILEIYYPSPVQSLSYSHPSFWSNIILFQFNPHSGDISSFFSSILVIQIYYLTSILSLSWRSIILFQFNPYPGDILSFFSSILILEIYYPSSVQSLSLR